MSEIKFRRDTRFRKQLFSPESFAHPAKMDAQLLIWIVERYTQVGEVILDPMGGSGTTMLACMLGRHVVLVELEEKFCKMMRDNWELVKMRPQLGYSMGQCQIIQGDARNLQGLLADCVITSPPYADTSIISGSKGAYSPKRKSYNPEYDNKEMEGYNQNNPDNIGNLEYHSYLEAMLTVYQQCYSVLKSQGLMVLVTKNFIRDKKVIRLDLDIIKLCEQAGFVFVEKHYRKLPSQSFWRIIYKQKFPDVETIDFEDVLVFKK